MSPPFENVSPSEWHTLVLVDKFENYFLIVAGVVPLWDHAITLAQEAELIWQRKLSLTTTLYLVNRIVGAWFGISMILLVADWATVEGCEAITVFNMAPMLLLDIVWASFSTLRVYAVSGHKRWIAALVFVLSLGPFLLDLTAYVSTIFVDVQFTRWVSLCAEGSRLNVQTFNALLFIGRIPLIIADALVLSVTWWNTFKIRKYAAKANTKSPLTAMLLRDGTFYFLAALSINAFQMVLFLYSDRYPIASYFVPIVTPVIISRCLLNLRSLSNTGSGTGTTAAEASRAAPNSRFQSVHFAAVHTGAETDGTVGTGGYSEAEDSVYYTAVGSTTTAGSGSRGVGQDQEAGMQTVAETDVTEVSRMA